MKWYGRKSSGDQGIIVDENTGASIAVVYDQANTDILAAAPDMYEELKIMTALVRLKYGNLDTDVYKEILKAERIIAEAEGL